MGKIKIAFQSVPALSGLLVWLLVCSLPLAGDNKIPELSAPLRQEKLPGSIYFRTNQASYNRLYYFIIHNGVLLYKYNKHLTGLDSAWQVLPVHKNLRRAVEISADDEYLLVIDEERRLFTMLEGLREKPDQFIWRQRWGYPFWQGKGIKIPESFTIWDASFISPKTDKYLLSPEGNRYSVGQGCTTMFLLNPDHRRITFIDPWLVNDFSNEIVTPLRGRFLAVNLSASGSVLFVINSAGEMYTLRYDFDIAGADTLFFSYSYNPEDYAGRNLGPKLVSRWVPRPLPIPGWQKQPPVEGELTDLITIRKTGEGAVAHQLLVEGRKNGQNGYFQKDIRDATWEFIPTGQVLKGRLLEKITIPPEAKELLDNHTFTGEVELGDFLCRVHVPDFNPYCETATVQLTTPSGESFSLTLHYNETIRLSARERGLYEKKLPLIGALQLPGGFRQSSGAASGVGEALLRLFKEQDFLKVKLEVTAETLLIQKPFVLKWKLRSPL